MNEFEKIQAQWEANKALLMPLVQMLSQFFVGNSSLGVSLNRILENKSYTHSMGQYDAYKARTNFTNPITENIYNIAGDKLYQSSLRLLGYPASKAQEMSRDGGPGVSALKWLASLGMESSMKSSASAFANAAYNQILYASPSANMRNARESYKAAGEAIFNSIAANELKGYTTSEALAVASTFIRQGRYNNIDESDTNANNTRVNRIKQDLKAYSEGIMNLRDGLQGSLEEVLQSFEKLTGSSATVMQKDRFTAITRSLYNATTFGGVTPQLLQAAVATQHAYLQGLGATQATSTAMGIVNANVIAQGATVEGATDNTMAEALNRLGGQWVSTGRLKELTAAFQWWSDNKRVERNAETFQQFINNELGGNIAADNVHNYLVTQNIDAAYINSSRVRRNMASPYMHQAFLQERVNQYQKQFAQLQKQNSLIQNEDIFISDDDFFARMQERYRASGLTDSEATSQADKAVRARRNMYGNLMYMTDADTGFNLLKNIGMMDRQQRRRKSTDIMAKLIGNNRSISGLAGALQTMLKDHPDEFTFADIVRGSLGLDLSNDQIRDLMKNGVTEDALRNVGLKESDITFALDHLSKLSSAERVMLFDESNDERKLRNVKDGDKITTYGDLRKSISQQIRTLRTLDRNSKDKDIIRQREEANKLLSSQLDRAVDEGLLSKSDAYTIRYGSRAGVNFGDDQAAVQVIKRTYEAATYAQEKLNKSKDEADKFGESIAKLSILDKNSKAYKDTRADIIKEMVKSKDYDNIKGDDKQTAEQKKQKMAEQHLDSLLKGSPDSIEEWLAAIFNELRNLVIK